MKYVLLHQPNQSSVYAVAHWHEYPYQRNARKLFIDPSLDAVLAFARKIADCQQPIITMYCESVEHVVGSFIWTAEPRSTNCKPTVVSDLAIKMFSVFAKDHFFALKLTLNEVLDFIKASTLTEFQVHTIRDHATFCRRDDGTYTISIHNATKIPPHFTYIHNELNHIN